MLPKAVESTTTNNRLEFVDGVHVIYKLRLPLYMVSASIRISFSSMWATTVTLDTASGDNILCCSAFFFG